MLWKWSTDRECIICMVNYTKVVEWVQHICFALHSLFLLPVLQFIFSMFKMLHRIAQSVILVNVFSCCFSRYLWEFNAVFIVKWTKWQLTLSLTILLKNLKIVFTIPYRYVQLNRISMWSMFLSIFLSKFFHTFTLF